MEKLPYLKDQLQTNIPKLVTIAKRVGQYPETDYHTKQPTGRMQTLYNFHLPDGPTVRHYAKEREEEVLSLFNAGETVQVVLQEGKNEETGNRYTFPVWTPKEGAEARAAANPQPSGNTRMDGDRKKLEEKTKAEEAKWERIALSKITHNFLLEAYKLGKTSGEAGADAKEWVRMQFTTVDQLAAEMTPSDFANEPEDEYPFNS